ncbi:putative bifunctional dTTP/UTP pyrophosphatase/methyltransferase protein [Varanus komodoensis]|uniref:Acetylserotonin O-methyltransferase like n=1 Tax=Varanus komodoensis TaxID=61221 RepID=A0A8D2L0I8_VARKO|nr:probable bifunctional dTTP/UTP pyrophosphatase/methyltransferase protein isoform X2 [Varanus komodoensis]KAF7253325.1 putative bifunctional dTTP/UTP pyrophosphatase/methyltransferase protein [Varanus komodoensis]
MVLSPVIGKLVNKRVVLASGSPRRQEILTNVGLRFEVVPSWFKETLEKSSFAAPYEYAVETAKQKALEVAKRMHIKHLKTPDVVIGADTIVTIDKQILEKPVDKQDAYKMLSRLNGKEHSVFTGVAIIHCSSNDNQLETDITDFYEETKVKFSELSEELLWEYIHSGEPMDKAGGYGIQALGGMLVEYVHGDFLNVVGFPLNHFCKKLAELYYPPPKHTIHHLKYDSIPSVETFEILSDGEGDSSENVQLEVAKKLNSDGVISSLGKRIDSNHNHRVSVEGQNVAAENAAHVPPTLVHLLDGFKASKAMFVACKLKVFDLLKDKGTMTTADAANQLNTSVCGTERLLDACTSLGLLEKSHQGYSNAELTNLYLVSNSEYSLHDYILHCNEHMWPLYTHLEAAVKDGTSQNHCASVKKVGNLFQDFYCQTPEVKQRVMSAMHCISKLTAKDIGTAFDLSQFRAVCDLGGCTGTLACELVHIYPEMRVTVLDLPDVITSVSNFQPSRQHGTQVSFISGDFFKDNLPEADLYILSRVVHHCSEEKLHTLLSKIFTICKPGGALLIAETVLDEKRTNPARAVLQSLSMTEGKQRSSLEYQQLLEKHGFINVQIKITGNLLDVILCFKGTDFSV